MQNQFKALVNQLQKTTLFITHDLDEAIRIGHRIAIMKDGIIVQIGRGLWGNPGADMLERAARQQNRAAELLQRARDSTEQTDIDRFTKIAENIKSAAETSIAQAEAGQAEAIPIMVSGFALLIVLKLIQGFWRTKPMRVSIPTGGLTPKELRADVHGEIQSLGAVFGHTGFDALLVKNKKRLAIGHFHHQLHHRFFDCNYGSVDMP
jgi:ABC-type proline/glycine betaine transport system ATPase subunit